MQLEKIVIFLTLISVLSHWWRISKDIDGNIFDILIVKKVKSNEIHIGTKFYMETWYKTSKLKKKNTEKLVN